MEKLATTRIIFAFPFSANLLRRRQSVPMIILSLRETPPIYIGIPFFELIDNSSVCTSVKADEANSRSVLLSLEANVGLSRSSRNSVPRGRHFSYNRVNDC